MGKKTDSEQKNLAELRAEFAEVKAVDIDPSKYGGGNWWWPKSCERYNPKSPISLLPSREHDFLDTLTFLVWANEDWRIRIAIPYLYKASLGRQSKRTIWDYLKKFQKYGLLEKVWHDDDEGNIYVVNHVLMRTEAAQKLSHFDLSSKLLIDFPKKRGMSRDQQLLKAKKMEADEKLSRAQA